MLYVVDHDSGKAWRASVSAPEPWTRKVLTADGGTLGIRAFPGIGQKVRAAPARPVASEAPAITVTRAADGAVTLTAPFTPRTLDLALELKTDTIVSDVRLNGEPVKLFSRPGKAVRMYWAPVPEGVSLSFKPAGPGSLDVAYAAYLAGWPVDARPLPPQPATVSNMLEAGSTVVTGKLRTKF